jgi:hypothetical protein
MLSRIMMNKDNQAKVTMSDINVVVLKHYFYRY